MVVGAQKEVMSQLGVADVTRSVGLVTKLGANNWHEYEESVLDVMFHLDMYNLVTYEGDVCSLLDFDEDTKAKLVRAMGAKRRSLTLPFFLRWSRPSRRRYTLC